MRISALRDDPDFAGYGYKVLLDGREVRQCVTADNESGEVVVYKTDQHGKLILNAARDEVEKQTLKGKVEIFPLLKKY